ncbi:MAG: DUF481 domain-containing protein [Planctomycetota bacterium]|nr:DUF481 domain-containing protein [Planctomycetota bacterium]
MLLPSIVPNRSIAIFLLIAGFCSRIDAQELPTASWRSGVSRWTGSGYADPGLHGIKHEIKSTNVQTPSTDLETPSTDLEKPDQVSSPEPDVPIVEPPTPFVDLGTKEKTSDQTEPAEVVGHSIDDSITDKTETEKDSTNPIDSDSTDSFQAPLDSVASSPASFDLGLSESNSSWHSKVISLWSNTWTGIRWLEGWDSQAELGLDGSSGNASTLGIHTGLESKRTTKYFDVGFDFDYRQTQTRRSTTEDNGRVSSDFDRVFQGTSHAAFTNFGAEWDRFKAFDLRLNLNGGYGYYWIRSDDASLVTRFGAGASREIGAPNDDWIPEAVFGLESDRKWSERYSTKQKIEYFPAWEDFSNFRLVADWSWEASLDEADKLRLKLSVNNRYDSTPQGARRNDLYYSLLLLYKF